MAMGTGREAESWRAGLAAADRSLGNQVLEAVCTFGRTAQCIRELISYINGYFFEGNCPEEVSVNRYKTSSHIVSCDLMM